MAKKRYCIKVPSPGGSGHQFVDVDPSRLNLEVLTQLYTRTIGAGGPSFQRAHGVEATVSTGVDPAALLERVKFHASELNEQLDAYGETGSLVKLELNDLETWLTALLTRFAAGHTDAAHDALSDMLYRITGVIVGLVARVERYEGVTDGLQAAIDRHAETEDGAAGAVRDFLVDWAMQADNLLIAVARLQELEQSFRTHQRVVQTEVTTWYGLLHADSTEFNDIVVFFNGDAERDSFLTMAYLYLRATKPNMGDQAAEGVPEHAEILERLAIAKKHISTCTQMSADVTHAWQELRRQRDVHLAKVSEVKRLVAQLRDATLRIRAITAVVKEGMERPCDLEQGALISAEDFRQSQALLEDPQWAPITCENRIMGTLNSANALIGQMPELPLNLQHIVADAQEYVDQLDRHFAQQASGDGRDMSEPSGGSAAPKAEVRHNGPTEQAQIAASSESAAHAARESKLVPARITQARLGEIVELVICVAYELGGKTANNFAGSTVSSMLDLLVRLGKISPEEAEGCRQGVRDHLKRTDVTQLVSDHGRMFKLPSSKNKVKAVTFHWHTSKLAFIRYKPRGVKTRSGGMYFYKLTKGMQRLAEELLVKHALNEAAIREAIVARREEYEREKAERKVEGAEHHQVTAQDAHDE